MEQRRRGDDQDRFSLRIDGRRNRTTKIKTAHSQPAARGHYLRWTDSSPECCAVLPPAWRQHSFGFG
jgi:hypothetical protein